jgi:hypothetical protein
MSRTLPDFTKTLKETDKGIFYRQRYTGTGAINSLGRGLANFSSASAAATHDDGTIDEISGIYAMTKSGNENNFVVVDDSVDDKMFIIDRDADKVCELALNGVTWSDAEEVSGYKDLTSGVSYILLMEFGDNSANKTTKTIYRFEEPTVTGSNLTVNTFDTIDFVYPASPIWEGGGILGDAEASFACPADGKIYIMSKRETRNFIFSLPIQSSYSGTQTLTYEGLMHADVAEETGGVISPANAVAACISNGLDNVLVKTYNKVYQFFRTNRNDTWNYIMTLSAPTEETNYVGRGSAPSQESQGEALCFEHNDNGYFTISEFNGQSSTPFFYYPLTEFTIPDGSSDFTISFTQGVNGYTGHVDTYIDGAAALRNTNYETEGTMIIDKQATTDLERYSFETWNDLGTQFGASSSNVVVSEASITYYVFKEGQGQTWHEITTAGELDLTTMTYNTVDGTLIDSGNECYNLTEMGKWNGADTYVGPITIALSANVIQSWIRETNSTTNRGWVGIGLHPSDGQQLSASDALGDDAFTNRPTLNVTYTLE